MSYFHILLSIVFIWVSCSVLYAEECDDEWENNINFGEKAERVYYIACVEVEWDYGPSGYDLVSGEKVSESTNAGTWLYGNGVDRIGSVYTKALYREFTDRCFTTEKARTSEQTHLGALGPDIRAIAGETIKIFYENQCRNPTSMHSHGFAYDKASEGAPYNDGVNDGSNNGDVVAANGGQWIYIWKARPNMVDAGTSSKMWIYHSHVDAVRDIGSGLVGASIITAKGYETSATNLKPRDVDREFTTFFQLYDENEGGSWLWPQNLAKITDADTDDEEFQESNLMHAINGYLFGNLDTLIMDECDVVRWYEASFGNEIDGPHSPHWHGNIVIDTLGDNTDTLVLIPGTTYTVTMTIDMPGTWLYHCHVHDHIVAGMMTTYTANETEEDCSDDDSDDSDSGNSADDSEIMAGADGVANIDDETEMQNMAMYIDFSYAAMANLWGIVIVLSVICWCYFNKCTCATKARDGTTNYVQDIDV